MIGGSVFSESGCITLVGELPTFILNCSVIWRTVYHVYFSFSGIYTCSTDFPLSCACKKQWCLVKYSHMPFSAAWLSFLDTFSIVMLYDGLVCSSFFYKAANPFAQLHVVPGFPHIK